MCAVKNVTSHLKVSKDSLKKKEQESTIIQLLSYLLRHQHAVEIKPKLA